MGGKVSEKHNGAHPIFSTEDQKTTIDIFNAVRTSNIIQNKNSFGGMQMDEYK
jgi:hypothetical protein